MTLLTVPQIAAKLHCTEWTARRIINAPDGIQASKVAGKWLATEADVDAYIESKSNRAPSARRRRRRAS